MCISVNMLFFFLYSVHIITSISILSKVVAIYSFSVQNQNYLFFFFTLNVKDFTFNIIQTPGIIDNHQSFSRKRHNGLHAYAIKIVERREDVLSHDFSSACPLEEAVKQYISNA